MNGQKASFTKQSIDQGVSPLPPKDTAPVAYCLVCSTRVLVRLQPTIDPRWMFGYCATCEKDGIARVYKPG